MKILILSGSPRGAKSQTRVLADALGAGAKGQGADVEIIDLAKVRIGFCQACEGCHKGPDCVLHDEGNAVLKRMVEADGVVLASPVYLDHVTAQMKALLDRTSHFVHCLRMTGKYVAAVTTSGGGGGAATVAFLQRYAVTVGAQFVGSVDARVPLQKADTMAAAKLGAALVAAAADKTIWPDQQKAIDEQRKRFGFIVRFHKDHWPYEHAYWQERGWC